MNNFDRRSLQTFGSAAPMSGSLGVVLRPCLVVVLIAVLNKRVTTDELLQMGSMYSFSLPSYCFWSVGKMLENVQIVFRSLSEDEKLFDLCLCTLLWLWWHMQYMDLLETWLNKHTAPLILRVLCLIVIWEKNLTQTSRRADQTPLWQYRKATKEGSLHVGALLMA